MKSEEINRAIAESLGWSAVYLVGNTYFGLSPDEKNESYTEEIPNYNGSLDACAEFERTCENSDYWRELRAVVGNRWFDRNTTNLEPWEMYPESATSLQRCEAYLRMKGLWNERHA